MCEKINKKFLFTTQTVSVSHTLKASYETSLPNAKFGKNHSKGEDLIKPSISAFLKTVLEKDDKNVKAMLFSNNTVSIRIDEMSLDINPLTPVLKWYIFYIRIDLTLSGTIYKLLCYGVRGV